MTSIQISYAKKKLKTINGNIKLAIGSAYRDYVTFRDCRDLKII